MLIRSLLIPALLICAVGAPIFLSEFKTTLPDQGAQGPNSVSNTPTFADPWQTGNNNRLTNGASLNSQTAQSNPFVVSDNPRQSRNLSAQTPQGQSGTEFLQARYSFSQPTRPESSAPIQFAVTQNSNLRTVPFGMQPAGSVPDPASNQMVTEPPTNSFGHSRPSVPSPLGFPAPNAFDTRQNSPYADSFGYEKIGARPTANPFGLASVSYPPSATGSFAELTPDYGATQTLIFPGNEFGPDLTAPPMEFLPITDFNEILRFDITSAWVKQRWKRVSTNPGDVGLHGLRIALVTGTNSWDLHGSLTYYFDAKQRLQRITFRGWTGDAGRLLQIMESRFEFQPQQTHLAGFYVVQNRRKLTGGLLMKDPPVLNSENPIEKLAIVMEINDPSGPFELSDEFRGLIAGSISQ